jgi:hypothetical protein
MQTALYVGLAWLAVSLIVAPVMGAFVRFGMEGKP